MNRRSFIKSIGAIPVVGIPFRALAGSAEPVFPSDMELEWSPKDYMVKENPSRDYPQWTNYTADYQPVTEEAFNKAMRDFEEHIEIVRE